MSSHLRHPYHLVDESPWPLLAAARAFSLTTGFLKWFHENSSSLSILAITSLLAITALWWRDVSREATFLGLHSSPVELGLRWGMALFITSEVLFFSRFFWAFFHNSLVPALELGGQWPPIGVHPFNPFGVPFFNTVILLRRGVSITWAHHSLVANLHTQALFRLKLTVILGIVFMAVQALEYREARFTFRDRVYGATFFMATGFHGLHVIVGATFLGVCTQRLMSYNFNRSHHFGFEAAAWYWHFVDVVWLFLFCTIYGWGALA